MPLSMHEKVMRFVAESKALAAEIDALPIVINRSGTEAIKAMFVPGEGLLPKLPQDPSGSMSPSVDEQFRSICDEIKALGDEIKALPIKIDRSATDTLKAMFVPGSGLLPELRQPVGVQGKGIKRPLCDENDDEDSSDATSGDDDEPVLKAKSTEAVLDRPSKKRKLGEDNAVEMLEGLQTEMETTSVPAPASLPGKVKPSAHQLQATASCSHAEPAAFKDRVDALLMTLANGRQRGDGPSLVVVPTSCCQQWIEEIKMNSKEGTTRALLLNDSSVSPLELYHYDVIVTSFSYVTSEETRLTKFKRQMEQYAEGKTDLVPKRPKVTLLSGIWRMNGVRPIGRYLVLDEAHAMKNRSGRSYEALKQLREHFEVCISTTGTPLDSTMGLVPGDADS